MNLRHKLVFHLFTVWLMDYKSRLILCLPDPNQLKSQRKTTERMGGTGLFALSFSLYKSGVIPRPAFWYGHVSSVVSFNVEEHTTEFGGQPDLPHSTTLLRLQWSHPSYGLKEFYFDQAHTDLPLRKEKERDLQKHWKGRASFKVVERIKFSGVLKVFKC